MERRLWIDVGVILALMLVYLTLPFLSVFVYGLFIYYISRPIYRWIKAKTKNSFFSAFTSIFFVILPVVVLILYTSVVAVTEMANIFSDYTIYAKDTLRSFISFASNIAVNIKPMDLVELVRQHQSASQYILGLGITAVEALFKLALSFILAFVLLRDEGKLKLWFIDTFLEKDKDIANEFLNDADAKLYSVFHGSILTSGVTAILGSAVFLILNVFAPDPAFRIPSPLLLGLLVGVANMIPVLGIKIVWMPLMIYVIAHASVMNVLASGIWFLVVFWFSVSFIVDSIPEYLIRPYTTSRHIPPGIMLFAYLFGPLVFGITGLFLGPMIVILSASFVKIVLPRLKKE